MSEGVGSKAANHSLARTLAALVGAPLAAFAFGAGLVALLPVSGGWTFLVGFHLVVPLWVALACGLPLLRNGRVAWAVCAALMLPLVATLVARRLG
ncbi:hypothetical protein JRI60_01320 [Archangium violaceum]|uniref:hypothetical protein n=1 Tax=Archangium violaceum TaxID=83451 RepID=UPI001951B992|nr:hypothetical protein [Archangium violaceum]QRN97756.1 hypothetical protein JRI60_01320 [Archangium violaceum]